MNGVEAKKLCGYRPFDCKELGKQYWKQDCRAAGRCVCDEKTIFEPHQFIICGDGVAPCRCGNVAEYLCDHPVGKGKTCDAPLCEACAVPAQLAPDAMPDELTQRRDPEARRLFLMRSAAIADTHFCPAHAARPLS